MPELKEYMRIKKRKQMEKQKEIRKIKELSLTQEVPKDSPRTIQERLKSQPNSYAQVDVEKELQEREDKLMKRLNHILYNLYADITKTDLPLDRKIELLKIKCDAKANKIYKLLKNEILDVETWINKLQSAEDK